MKTLFHLTHHCAQCREYKICSGQSLRLSSSSDDCCLVKRFVGLCMVVSTLESNVEMAITVQLLSSDSIDLLTCSDIVP